MVERCFVGNADFEIPPGKGPGVDAGGRVGYLPQTLRAGGSIGGSGRVDQVGRGRIGLGRPPSPRGRSDRIDRPYQARA